MNKNHNVKRTALALLLVAIGATALYLAAPVLPTVLGLAFYAMEAVMLVVGLSIAAGVVVYAVAAPAWAAADWLLSRPQARGESPTLPGARLHGDR